MKHPCNCVAFASGNFEDGAKLRTVLVLQGGGALGAYQVGSYEAMLEQGYQPDVVSGISIGAINAALIAGNPPEKRLAQMKAFWDHVSIKPLAVWPPAVEMFAPYYHWLGVTQALILGQPNFFRPRLSNPYFSMPGSDAAVSFADSSELRATLVKFIDFDLINSGAVRLFLGAARISDGEMIYFDNTVDTITPEHVMASGALPPAFAAVQIGSEYYWDGGVASNSPIDAVLDAMPNENMRIFMPTLFNPSGPVPKTMMEVTVKQKQIQYAMRARRHIDRLIRDHQLRTLLAHPVLRAAAENSDDESLKAAIKEMRTNHIEIVHVMYEWQPYETEFADTDFAQVSTNRRMKSGYKDMKYALENVEPTIPCRESK